MGKKNKQQLSQAEIWDDSALIRSWDDALTEYKLYHSIHARGERVEDVLRDIEAQDEGIATDSAVPNGTTDAHEIMDRDILEDGEVAEDEENSVPHDQNTRTEEPVTSSLNSHPRQQAPGANDGGYPQDPPSMPNAVLGKVEDEALKNLMMSWYFAGYYTGLHEGQQQATQTPAQGPSGERNQGD